jgi:hypothetical protein
MEIAIPPAANRRIELLPARLQVFHIVRIGEGWLRRQAKAARCRQTYRRGGKHRLGKKFASVHESFLLLAEAMGLPRLTAAACSTRFRRLLNRFT